MFHWFYCFLCSWIWFPCLYLDNVWLILFFVVCLCRMSLYFMMKLVSCFKFLLSSLGKSKWKVLGFVVIKNFLLSMCTPIIIIMTWLNYCKPCWWFYYADAKIIIFVWFRFSFCINCFLLLFVLIILEVWLKVCLEFGVRTFNPFPLLAFSS